MLNTTNTMNWKTRSTGLVMSLALAGSGYSQEFLGDQSGWESRGSGDAGMLRPSRPSASGGGDSLNPRKQPTVSSDGSTQANGPSPGWSYAEFGRLMVRSDRPMTSGGEAGGQPGGAASWSDSLQFDGGTGQGLARFRFRVQSTFAESANATDPGQGEFSFNQQPMISGNDLSGEFTAEAPMTFGQAQPFEIELHWSVPAPATDGPTVSPQQPEFEGEGGTVIHTVQLLAIEVLDHAGRPIASPDITRPDGSTISPRPFCNGDANGDRRCDLADLHFVLGNFNEPGFYGDMTGDGFVGFDDLQIVIANFNSACDE